MGDPCPKMLVRFKPNSIFTGRFEVFLNVKQKLL